MPLPKRRHSNARTRKRRTHYKLTTTPTLSACPRCGKARLAHHVCPSCGHYGTGASLRQVVDVTKRAKPEETEEQDA